MATTKVYVVHEHEPSEGSTILYAGTSKTTALGLAHTRTVKSSLLDIDIAELELNLVPEERDITLKVSKRELDEILDSLDRKEVAGLAEYIRGLK